MHPIRRFSLSFKSSRQFRSRMDMEAALEATIAIVGVFTGYFIRQFFSAVSLKSLNMRRVLPDRRSVVSRLMVYSLVVSGVLSIGLTLARRSRAAFVRLMEKVNGLLEPCYPRPTYTMFLVTARRVTTILFVSSSAIRIAGEHHINLPRGGIMTPGRTYVGERVTIFYLPRNQFWSQASGKIVDPLLNRN